MSRQVSRGSAGEYQADERAGVARLRWPTRNKIQGFQTERNKGESPTDASQSRDTDWVEYSDVKRERKSAPEG